MKYQREEKRSWPSISKIYFLTRFFSEKDVAKKDSSKIDVKKNWKITLCVQKSNLKWI